MENIFDEVKLNQSLSNSVQELLGALRAAQTYTGIAPAAWLNAEIEDCIECVHEADEAYISQQDKEVRLREGKKAREGTAEGKAYYIIDILQHEALARLNEDLLKYGNNVVPYRI